jgi:photosystem II stability/assembly factor-like uncharacterized protein
MNPLQSVRLLTTIITVLITTFSLAQNWHMQNTNHTGQITGIQMLSNIEGWACGDAGTILHTIDAGETWNKIILTGADLHQLIFKDASTGVVVGDGGTIFTTTNGGTNWISKTSNTAAQLRSVAFSGGSTFYAVGRDGVAVKSTDDGNTWTVLNSGTVERLLCVSSVGDKVWVGARNGLLIYSSNGGTSFSNMSSPATDDIKDIQFINQSVGFACGSGSFFMFTGDGGSSWTSRSSGIQFGLNGLHFMNENFGWTVGGAGTLYSTSNAGINWIPEQSGTGQDLNSIHSFDGLSGWAVGNVGVVVTNFSSPTSAEIQGNIIPNNLVVEQNYPNPFNPSTKIRFSLPAESYLTLDIFNLTGQKVKQLISDRLSAGKHEVNFDASNLTSGIYIYQIKTGLSTNGFSETRKMMLVK